MRNSALPSPVYLTCFHKTGTNLLGKILRDLSKKLEIQYWYYNTTTKRHGLPEPEEWDIFFDHHSLYLDDDYSRINDSITITVVRDPRDVIISGAHYHKKSDEIWLHHARTEFDGLTYQEKICSLENDEERFIFEMDHAASVTIKRMKNILNTDNINLIVKFEDLVSDYDMVHFENMFNQMGIEESIIGRCKEIALSHSLFNIEAKDDPHIRSGKPKEWESVYNDRLKLEYTKRFGNLHELLGYQPF